MADPDLVVRMPQMGVSVEEGIVTAWHVAVGDRVEVGQPICDVATDKVDTEVAAETAGVVAELLAAEGETVAVGGALARLVGEAVPAAIAAPLGFDPEAAADDVLDRTGPAGRLVASPLARRLAAELDVDLSGVAGSGRRGRIRKEDVLAAERGGAADTLAGTDARGETTTELPRGYDDVPHEVVATTHLRRLTAEHMIRSRQTAAHMTTTVEVDLQRLTAIRAALNAEREAAARPRLSFLPFIARATCAALHAFPGLNATFETERTIRWREINLGVAVDTPQGLLVPVVRGAQKLGVEALAERLADVADRARARKLTADDVRAGTFTISNPGSVGATSAMAIINQPQVAILGLPAIVRRPWVVDLPDGGEAIVIRPILEATITFDHRAIDGAEATRCAVHLKGSLESWALADYR